MNMVSVVGKCPVFCNFRMAFKQDTVTMNLYDGNNFSKLRFLEISSNTNLVSGDRESAVTADVSLCIIATTGVTVSPKASIFKRVNYIKNWNEYQKVKYTNAAL